MNKVPNLSGKVFPTIMNFGCRAPPLQVKKAQSPRYGFEYILNQGGQVNEYAMSTGYAKTY